MSALHASNAGLASIWSGWAPSTRGPDQERRVRAALSPAWRGNDLFFCPYPACFGSAAVLGAARKEGEVVANAQWPPPTPPPVLPRSD